MKRSASKSGMQPAPARKLRCAVYTRKSTEEGLDMEFNSLDAQREACESYIASQRAEGWHMIPDRYDDGGVSGGTLERPALKQLLEEIERGRIDIVVVYKIDRLSRSLMDFAKLVEVFERNNVTFVSVTQAFSTTTSMGRLTLNILLSFAQFEREVIGERIRDKFAASRKKGMWMGGWAPLGYRINDRKPVIDEPQAAVVREIFRRYAKLESPSEIVRDLAARCVVNKYGKPIDRAMLYTILRNRTYIGEASHKGTAYPGEHKAIIDRKLWDQVKALLEQGSFGRGRRSSTLAPALLKGLIFGPNGKAMSPTHTRKGNKLYRYYVSQSATKTGPEDCSIGRVSAGEIEAAVINRLRALLKSPEVVVTTWRAARKEIKDLSEREVREALEQLDPIWDELFPVEQARIVQLLVERVDVGVDGLDIQLRLDGFRQLVTELDNGDLGKREAA